MVAATHLARTAGAAVDTNVGRLLRLSTPRTSAPVDRYSPVTAAQTDAISVSSPLLLVVLLVA